MPSAPGGGLHTDPVVVLLVSPLEVQHPVTQGLECSRGQAAPDARYHTIVEGAGHIVQLGAHTHLTSQGLNRGAGKQGSMSARNTVEYVSTTTLLMVNSCDKIFSDFFCS